LENFLNTVALDQFININTVVLLEQLIEKLDTLVANEDCSAWLFYRSVFLISVLTSLLIIDAALPVDNDEDKVHKLHRLL